MAGRGTSWTIDVCNDLGQLAAASACNVNSMAPLRCEAGVCRPVFLRRVLDASPMTLQCVLLDQHTLQSCTVPTYLQSARASWRCMALTEALASAGVRFPDGDHCTGTGIGLLHQRGALHEPQITAGHLLMLQPL
jgi:hypothetical protein